MNKYRLYNSDNKVIAVSTYAGKPVRGIAKCNPSDTFSLEGGEALAVARCNEKIAEKRMKRAARKAAEAQEAFIVAKRYYERMNRYLEDSVDNLATAKAYVDDVLNQIAP